VVTTFLIRICPNAGAAIPSTVCDTASQISFRVLSCKNSMMEPRSQCWDPSSRLQLHMLHQLLFVVCTEPLEWVAIGRCGHRVVCCASARFFYRNKRCCVCRTYCFRVVVTRGPTQTGRYCRCLPFWKGQAGQYWNHRHTVAFFGDQKEYEEAKRTSFYHTVVSSLLSYT
jgi:hypothetical protein